MQQQLKWYDYLAVFWFADSISAGLLSGNIIVLILGCFSYIMYESWRKEDG